MEQIICTIFYQIPQHAMRDNWRAAIGWPISIILFKSVQLQSATSAVAQASDAGLLVQEVSRACRTLKWTRVYNKQPSVDIWLGVSGRALGSSHL